MTVVVEDNQDFDRNAKVAFGRVRIDVGMDELEAGGPVGWNGWCFWTRRNVIFWSW
jgi:hypothetical protein